MGIAFSFWYERPMKERLALCLLGAWLMGSLMMFAVAPQNFYVIDHLLESSPNARFHALAAELGPGSLRECLRYLASELNRTFFLQWNVLQVVLGGAVVWLCWQRQVRPRPKVPALAAMFHVALLLGVITPLITRVGRSLDFVPRAPAPPQLSTFQLAHVAYTLLDVLKVLCVGVATVLLLRTHKGDLQEQHRSAS